ncbi:hypothetical protein, partial [Candidatus Ichthyocystis sparus]|uniref:hypothetical protein n=1 Tax=Candidatus Ichthyocystis sparus TaxID=1561004 RepID=UPI00159EE16D
SETSSPLIPPPPHPLSRQPRSSRLPLHRRPLLSACSKVGSQPQRISLPSHSAGPSVGRHFPPGLHPTWS